MLAFACTTTYLQSVIGAIGTSSDVLSKLRRPKVTAIGNSTREGESKRLFGTIGTPATVGPGNYHFNETDLLGMRSPIATIGRTVRGDAALGQGETPGPSLVRVMPTNDATGHPRASGAGTWSLTK